MTKPILREIRFPVSGGRESLEPNEQKTFLIDGMMITIHNVGLQKKYYSLDKRIQRF